MRNALFRISTSTWTLLMGFSLAFAVLFSGAGLFNYQHSRVFLHNARIAPAEVVEMRGRSPIFQYQVDGNVFEYQPPAGPLAQAALGDSAILFFNSENPTDVRDSIEMTTRTGSWLTALLLALSGLSWLSVSLCAFMRYQSRRQTLGLTAATSIETACTFVALEGSADKTQTARRIRLICRWVHPETGEEWILKSSAVSPAELPPRLEVGSKLRCRVNFNNPTHHEIQVA